jgi:CDP-diacylglycerol--glycerol-3-phosphate 3-phosphatidyltransferase
MFDKRFRTPIEKAVRPVGIFLRRIGMSPDHLTILGVVVSCGAAVAIGAGATRGGLVLVILAALPDMLDGAVAKAGNDASQRGSYFDSVMDRLTDAILMGGVAWYFGSEYGAHAAVLPFAVQTMSSLISYQRAKAEALGLDAKGGLMERAERIVLLCVGLLFDSLFLPIMWLMLVLTTMTVIQRFLMVWRQAEVSNSTQAKRDERSRRRVQRQERFSSRATRRHNSRRMSARGRRNGAARH